MEGEQQRRTGRQARGHVEPVVPSAAAVSQRVGPRAEAPAIRFDAAPPALPRRRRRRTGRQE